MPEKKNKVVATNKKAYFNFYLDQTWECGIALKGGEVKSIRAGEVNFKDSFARIEDDEMYLYSLHINPYPQASYLNDEPDRVRKLLLHAKEIQKIKALVQEKNLALVPTKIYFSKRGMVKLEIAVGRGKKLYDKRDTSKKREIDRGLKRRMMGQKGK